MFSLNWAKVHAQTSQTAFAGNFLFEMILTRMNELCRRNLFRPFTGYQYQLFVATTSLLNLCRKLPNIIFFFFTFNIGTECPDGKSFWNDHSGIYFVPSTMTEPNLSRFLMQIYQFGKWKFSRSEYTRRDGIVSENQNLLPKNLEPCQTYHRLEALGPSRPLLLLLAGGPSTGKHHNTGQHHNTG